MGDPAPPVVTLSVVIVSYNTREQTLACLDSLDRQATGFTTEVVLVDNASSDGTVTAVGERFPGTTVIASTTNRGFARGVNSGVEAARGEFVLLLNPDSVVVEGTLARIVAFAQAHEDHGLYGGRTLRPDGGLDPSSCWGEPTLWSLFCFATGLSTLFRGSLLFDPESLGGWQRDTVREVPVVTGCLLLVRRRVFLALGGFDPVFFLYGEDAELSIRARRAGWRPVIVPEATIVHEVGASSTSAGAKMRFVMAGKATLLRQTWRGPKLSVGLFLLAAGAGLRASLEAVSRRERQMWSVVWRDRRSWLPGYPEAERVLVTEADA